MKVDVQTEIVINASIDVVSAFAADPKNAPLWYKNIDSADWKGDKAVKIGNRVAFRARFLSRTLEYEYEIIDYEPNKRLVMSTAHGPFPMETTYEWSEAGDGTKMKLRNRGMPTGFNILMAPLMRLAIRRANLKDLKLLKCILEN